MSGKNLTKIGLTADELINFATAEHMTRLFDKKNEVLQDEGITEAEITNEMHAIISEEAIMDTVAAMIERNNQVLLQHLIKLGVIRDS